MPKKEHYRVYVENFDDETSIENLLNHLFQEFSPPSDSKIFVKPNLVYWNTHTDFPKYGVLTTSTVVFCVIKFLFEKGYKNVTIGEGMATTMPNDPFPMQDAFQKLGYKKLEKDYGVKLIDIFQDESISVQLTPKLHIKMNKTAIRSDVIINLPVLKTHSQTRVSLGIKNLKGLLNVPSRKLFHDIKDGMDLQYKVAQLANPFPSCLTIIDGIYSIDRGPIIDGKAHRTNALVGSWDIFSADVVGTAILGIDLNDVPYLVQAAKDRKRSLDLSKIQIAGKHIDEFTKKHSWEWKYNETRTLPLPLDRIGMKGLNYYQFDDTLCTYCSFINGPIISVFYEYWKSNNRADFNKIEVLTGKLMEPQDGMETTILLGKCMYKKHKDNPKIKRLIPIPGCPPTVKMVKKALDAADVILPEDFYQRLETIDKEGLKKYHENPDFIPEFYKI